MSVTMIQSTFQFGEVSELLHARVDSPIYYKAVKRLRNMLVIPQGGVERRFGTTYIDAVNDHSGGPVYITNYTQVKPYIFDYEDGSRYLLIFRDASVDIYSAGVYQSTTATPWGPTDIADLAITQSANIVFIVHGFPKITDLSSTKKGFAQIEAPMPSLTSLYAAFVEFFGGIMVLLGIYSGWASFLLAIDMLGAMLFVKWKKPFVSGWEFDFVLFIIAVAILLAGPGDYNLAAYWSSALTH